MTDRAERHRGEALAKIDRRRPLGGHECLLGFIFTLLLWLIEEAGWRIYYSDA